jgi:hypothetical protein
MPALEIVANDRGWRLVTMAKPACPAARVLIYNVYLKREYTECAAWREAALSQILALHPVAVLIANRQMQELLPKPRDWYSAWRDGSRKTLELLNSAGLTTILMRDTPGPEFDVPSCLAGNVSWLARRRGTATNLCTLNRAVAVSDEVFRAEQLSAAGLSHVFLLDLTEQFCDGAVCPAVRNGVIAYRDGSHISAEFARSLAPVLAGHLTSILEGASR